MQYQWSLGCAKPSVSNKWWILESLKDKEFEPHSEYTGVPVGVFKPRSGIVSCFHRATMVGVCPKERGEVGNATEKLL